LTEVERDRVVLFKKVKELQKQLEMQNKVRQEGTEAKDFKGEERVSDIEALTAALSDTEVTVKALEADRISLQKRVEEG
jgi:ribosomal protein L16/L10AE